MQDGLFDLKGRVVVVTGATGVLAGSAAEYLAGQGARVVYLARTRAKIDAALEKCRQHVPAAELLGVQADVTDRAALDRACEEVIKKWGRIDGLLNAAGGNQPGATIAPEKSFFDLDMKSFDEVVLLNLQGSVIPTLVFGKAMTGSGSIINYSSASVARTITRVVGYSAAKAGVENFTRWLGVELARQTAGRLRVNALVPGFFLADQNRKMLVNPDGTRTARGESIIRNTPMGRFGESPDLHGALHFLLSDASTFVTGIALPVDGGFAAFSGV